MNRAAFSLIEVLVAMVIVSLITTTGMFAFKLSISQINRQDSLTFEEPMHFTQLKNLFNATYFYTKEVRDPFKPNEFEYIYMFTKSEREITFVSDAPIYSKKLSLINLKIIDDKLIYKETAIYDEKQDYKNPVFFEDTVEHEILHNIQNAKFIYEKPIDLPKDFESNIPKLVTLKFERVDVEFRYIFDIKYNFYQLKQYLKGKRSVE